MDETASVQSVTDAATAPAGPPVSYERGGALGRFLVLETIGAGGMGVVVAAYDPELDRRVALKLLRSPTGGDDASLRLQREAQAMARLAHPNVVTVFEVGTVDRQVYVAMEFVEGETLRAWLARQPRAWREVLDVFAAAGRGLAAAHAAGLVHRDFKPDNVLVGKDGRVRVADFGLASSSSRLLESSAPDLRAAIGATDLLRGLTVEGAVLGTPAYMAPEQHAGAAVDARADQFAFCVALFEALYGERPFRGATYSELAAEVKAGRVRDLPRTSKVPSWLRAVVARGLAAQPDERHPSMDALLRALAVDPTARRRRAIGAGAGVLVAGLAAWGLLRSTPVPVEPCTGARELLAAAWSPPVRARIEQAFLATGKAYARDTFDRVSARLGAYADRWAAMHTDACRATRVRGEQSQQLLDLRLSCLERRHRQLAALTELFTGADAAMLAKAARASGELDPVDDCADAPALLAQVPPPRDAATAAKVADVERRLDRLESMLRVGRYKEMADEAKAAVADADATGHTPVRAVAHYTLGRVGLKLHDFDSAERELLAAARLAAEAHDDHLFARALLELAVGYLEASDDKQALAMARAADAAARRTGDDLRIAYGQLTASMALQGLSRQDESRAAADAAFAGFERRAGREDQSRLITPLIHMCESAQDHNRYAEARALAERALAISAAAQGPEHPTTPILLHEASVSALALGQIADARDFAERAMRLGDKLNGPDHFTTTQHMMDLAGALVVEGDLDRAAALDERALAIAEKTLGPKHSSITHALLGLADVRARQGRLDEAQALAERAVALRTESKSPDLAAAQGALADVLARRGRFAEARPLADKLLAQSRTVMGADHLDTAEALILIARIDAGAGRCGDAQKPLAEAVAALEKGFGAEHFRIADALVLEGRCALAGGRAGEAVPLLARAVAILDQAQLAAGPREEAHALLARAQTAAPRQPR